MFESEFAKIPLEAPRPLDMLPGLRLRDAIPKTMLFLPLLFFVFFISVPLTILSTDPTARLALGPAEIAQGHIVAVGAASACRGAASRRVKFSFMAGGHEYRGAATLCEESAYYSVQEGDAVDVRYLLRDPAINALHTGRSGESPPFVLFFIMPLFFLVLFSALYAPSLRDVRRAKRLYRTGRLAIGHVTFVKKRSSPYWAGMPGAGTARVFVVIPAAASGTREVVAICRNDWLTNQLTVGSTVHVAYEDKSKDAALLDAYWR